MPKHIEKKTQCEPCPDCVASSPTFAGSDEQQCKVGRKAIVSMGVPVYFNYTQLNKRTTGNILADGLFDAAVSKVSLSDIRQTFICFPFSLVCFDV